LSLAACAARDLGHTAGIIHVGASRNCLGSMFFVKHEVEDVSRIDDLVNSEQLSQQQI